MIVISNYKEMPLLKTKVDQVVSEARKLFDSGALRRDTQYGAPLGAAQANHTYWTETTPPKKLRIDRQRVVGIGEKVTPVTKYAVKKAGKGAVGFDMFATMDAAKAAAGKKRVTELKSDDKTYDAIFTLFATQKDRTHHQVFVLNNNNMLNNLGGDNFEKVWKYTLQNQCTAIITDQLNNVPAGVDQGYAMKPEYM